MKEISNAELEVMKVIWNKGEITSKEIIEQVKECNWNDNTVRTLINRLINKKIVGISEKKGKTYTFVHLVKKEEYIKDAKTKFLKQFFNGSVKEFLIFLIEDKEYSLEVEKAINDVKDRRKIFKGSSKSGKK